MKTTYEEDVRREAAAVGRAIAAARKKHGFRQKELAYRIGLSQAQLCHLEKGVTRTALGTLQRIADALGVPVLELMGDGGSVESLQVEGLQVESAQVEGLQVDSSRGGKSEEREREGAAPKGSGEVVERYSGLWEVHDPKDEMLTRPVKVAMARHVRAIKALETSAGLPRATTLPLSFPQAMSAGSGPYLARCVRAACGLGPEAVVDPLPFFEGKGLRVVRMKLPLTVRSWSLFDPEDRNAFVFLPADATDERLRFRIAYEVSHVIRCATLGFRPVSGRSASRKFSREFAATFLLPEEAVRETTFQLGATPKTWTWELLLHAKGRFGVSAEMFAYRLDDLGLISRGGLQTTLRKLRAYYDEHPERPEPPAPKWRGRLDLCRALAKA